MTYFPHDVMDIMEHETAVPAESADAVSPYPFRRAMGVIETVLAIAAGVGVVQLAAGIATPPDAQLPPGLHSWAIPAVWLFATVFLPSTAAAVALFNRARSAPDLVLVATVALGAELVVQIPFLGWSWLQLVVGIAAVAAAVLAWRARQRMR
jgi:hypothetical protein